MCYEDQNWIFLSEYCKQRFGWNNICLIIIEIMKIRELMMKKQCFILLAAFLCILNLGAQEFPLRQAFDLRWEGFRQRTTDNSELVFWTDTPAGHRDIFAQKLGPNGQTLWNEALPVVNHEGDQELLGVVPSSDNNFILLWGEYDIYNTTQLRLQKITSNGQRLWPEGGVQLGVVGTNIRDAMLLPNSVAGAFVIYQNWFVQEIRGQNLDGWGNQLWPAEGIVVASHSSNLNLDSAVVDGEGGFIIDVSKYTGGTWVTELSRFSPQGTVVGNNPLIPVNSMPNLSRYSILPSTNGSYILYRFGFSPNSGLWLRRIDNLGVPSSPYTTVWSLPLNENSLLPPVLVPTADGGTMICYECHPSSGRKLLVERISADFEDDVWPYPGVQIATGIDPVWRGLTLAPTATGGAWLSWMQYDDVQGGVYVRGQYVDPEGALPWGMNGLALSSSGNFNRTPVPAAYPDRGVFYWFDKTDGVDKVQRQVVSTGGSLFLNQGGIPLMARLAGRADLVECVALGDRFFTIWVDERQNMCIYYQISTTPDLLPILEQGGLALNPPSPGFEILIDAQKTPWNTVAMLYRQMSDDYTQLCYLQEIDATGGKAYPGPGIFLGTNLDFNYRNTMSFWGGDIYLGWTVWNYADNYQIHGQRISGGQKQWGEEGRLIVALPQNCFASLEAVQGPYYLWRQEDYNQNLTQCRVLRVSPSGYPAPGWSDFGISILDDTGFYNQEVELAGMRDEDLIVFLRLSQYGNYPHRAQRISTTGQRLWQDSGVAVVPDGQPAWVQDAVFGLETGFVYSLQGTANDQLLFQRIDDDGQLLLPEASLLAEGLNNCYDANLIRFADGCWLCAWSDYDGALLENRNVFISYLTSQGIPQGGYPTVFCDARYQQQHVKVAVIGNLALVAWSDDRAGILNSETAVTGIWGRTFISDAVAADDPIAPPPLLPVLHANYPNPFNPSTTISFTLPTAGRVSLRVYNLKGQLVRSLVEASELAAGQHSFVFNGLDDRGTPVGSGVYLYRLVFGYHSLTRRMVLAK